MNKIKNIFALIIIAILIYSCDSDSPTTIEDFDHAAQYEKDKDTLSNFLKNHYFDTTVDSIKTLVTGKTPLSNDEKLQSMVVKENDIDYTLYYYTKEVGNPTVNKGKPTVMDSIFVKYYGQRIVNTDSISNTFDNKDGIWFNLTSVIRGWSYGFTNFKGGDNITNNGPITYENGGKGVLFIPSGLAYRNSGSNSILPNECLLFYIDLYDFVKDTDHDNDGVASILEDPDGDEDPRNDNTDGDFLPNYLDNDDDGDGILTKKEDTKITDGNPANDFSDPNNPNLPDYLNKDIKKSL